MMQQAQMAAAAAVPPPQDQQGGGGATEEAPPKQVALAMERLTRAARLIADIRLGADHLLEALFGAGDSPQQPQKTVQFVVKVEASMSQHFEDLRVLGRQLEDSGVLSGSLKSRGNSWGLHMPLVCPDGAVVAYAWKRQLAGQAGASAVDRTRLALKAFTDQKGRFFPHLEDKTSVQACDGDYVVSKRQRISQGLGVDHRELREEKTLSDVLNLLDPAISNIRVFTYQRLDWLKRASSLSSSLIDNITDQYKEQSFRTSNKLRAGTSNVAADQVTVIELLVPSIFRAVVSLHPAGSINPDAVAFFSPDEEGNYIHARGLSVFHVFRHVTEFADKALQHFLSVDSNTSLSLLLHWICSYQTLFTKACSKCARLLMMDKSLALLLPPVHRSYTNFNPSARPPNTADATPAFHIGCSN